METLKPCPWCKPSAPLLVLSGKYHAVRCNVCRLTGPWHEDRNAAIAAWNARPLEDDLEAKLRRAVEACREADDSVGAYIDEYSLLHDHDDCPEDDTCECEMIDDINNAMSMLAAVLDENAGLVKTINEEREAVKEVGGG